MTRCPVCRAVLAPGQEVCRRCQADLRTLLAIEHQAHNLTIQAIRALQAGRFTEALDAARESQLLQETPFTRVLLRFLGAPHQ